MDGAQSYHFGKIAGMVRLREIRQAKGLKLHELAEKIGVTEVSMSRYEREPSRLNYPLLVKLADALDTSIAAICGEEPEHHTEPRELTYEADQPPLYNGRLMPMVQDIGGTEFAVIPRYDMGLSAGPGALVEAHAEPLGYVLMERQWVAAVTRALPENLVVLRVRGDSMRPTFDDGDWLLIDRAQRRVNVQGVYAIMIGDTAWVKRLSINLRDKLVRIISDNPVYPEEQLADADIDVIGRVVWMVGRRI